MFKVNEYYGGKVKSIAFQSSDLPATVGVMAPGEYTFDTSSQETMTVISGMLAVQLPGVSDWRAFAAGESFVVAAGQAFQLRVAEDTAYLCTYA
ncbi:MAG: pyrimidine/purine nucleoside phosphorylase [Magnetococcales bacterium]|nr:pyrimidine/purine nucleoside phosphorylase [Magnetococcales bacterium]MBF0115884.1 pyrimidine/purine nucleoside phosphorylase [Magnetococcales bacterium]